MMYEYVPQRMVMAQHLSQLLGGTGPRCLDRSLIKTILDTEQVVLAEAIKANNPELADVDPNYSLSGLDLFVESLLPLMGDMINMEPEELFIIMYQYHCFRYE